MLLGHCTRDGVPTNMGTTQGSVQQRGFLFKPQHNSMKCGENAQEQQTMNKLFVLFWCQRHPSIYTSIQLD